MKFQNSRYGGARFALAASAICAAVSLPVIAIAQPAGRGNQQGGFGPGGGRFNGQNGGAQRGQRGGQPGQQQMGGLPTVSGSITGGDASAKIITISGQGQNASITIKLDNNTKLVTQSSVSVSDLKIGDQVQVQGLPTAITANSVLAGDLSSIQGLMGGGGPGGPGGFGPGGGPGGPGGFGPGGQGGPGGGPEGGPPQGGPPPGGPPQSAGDDNNSAPSAAVPQDPGQDGGIPQGGPGGFGPSGQGRGGAQGFGGQGGFRGGQQGGRAQSNAMATGRVTAISPLTISLSDSVSVVIKMAPGAKVTKIQTIAFSSLKVGDKLVAAGTHNQDGSFSAQLVGINLELGRGGQGGPGGPGQGGGPGGFGPPQGGPGGQGGDGPPPPPAP